MDLLLLRLKLLKCVSKFIVVARSFPPHHIEILNLRLKLRNPIYEETAAYGHMGREPRIVTKTYDSAYNGGSKTVEVELFTWEKLDYVDEIRAAFKL